MAIAPSGWLQTSTLTLAPADRDHDVSSMSSGPAAAPTPTLPRRRGREAAARATGGWGLAAIEPSKIVDRVLYRDGLMLVIDKPAGIPVHAGPGGGPHLEHWFPLLRFGLPRPPALAHRLDRDTSGCLVLGRHPKALRRLGRLFAEGRVEKIYWAVVAGVPAEPKGRIDAALAKQPRGIVGWRMVLDPAGTRAITDYRILGSANGR